MVQTKTVWPFRPNQNEFDNYESYYCAVTQLNKLEQSNSHPKCLHHLAEAKVNLLLSANNGKWKTFKNEIKVSPTCSRFALLACTFTIIYIGIQFCWVFQLLCRWVCCKFGIYYGNNIRAWPILWSGWDLRKARDSLDSRVCLKAAKLGKLQAFRGCNQILLNACKSARMHTCAYTHPLNPFGWGRVGKGVWGLCTQLQNELQDFYQS